MLGVLERVKVEALGSKLAQEISYLKLQGSPCLEMYQMLEKSRARVNLIWAKENYNFLKTQVPWQVSESASLRVCGKDHSERSKHRKPRLYPGPVKNENVKR